jgi:hypothetical protein
MIQSSFLSFTELFQYMQKQMSPNHDDYKPTQTTNMLNMYTGATRSYRSPAYPFDSNSLILLFQGTVLKILHQAVEEIKRGLDTLCNQKDNADTSLNESGECGGEFDLSPSASSPASQHHQPQTFDIISHFDRTLVVIVHYLIVVAESIKHSSPEDTYKLKKLIYELVKLNPKNSRNLTILHLASTKDSSSIIKNHTLNNYPSIDVIRLLLECGADVDARDSDKNTCLHLAVSNRTVATATTTALDPSSPKQTNERDKLILLLLSSGAHLDAVNSQGKTANDLCKGSPKLYSLIQPVNYLTLQCLAARAIKKHSIPYNDCLNTKLANFVDIH